MEIIDLISWDDFEQELHKLNKRLSDMQSNKSLYTSPILFRGQEDACWELKTTLERCSKQNQFDAKDYFNITRRVKPQVETFTGRQWQVDLDDYEKWEKMLIFFSV